MVAGAAVTPSLPFGLTDVSRDRVVPGRDNFGPITVPESKFFMLGDNRDNSRDSRYWGFVDYSQLRGKALFIYWSWDKEHNLPRLSRIFDLVR